MKYHCFFLVKTYIQRYLNIMFNYGVIFHSQNKHNNVQLSVTPVSAIICSDLASVDTALTWYTNIVVENHPDSQNKNKNEEF